MQSYWDGQGSCRRRCRVVVFGFREQSALDDGLGELLDEQRDAIGVIDDLIRDSPWQRFAAGHAHNHLGALPTWKTVEAKQCHMRTADPGWRKLRPEGDDHQ